MPTLRRVSPARTSTVTAGRDERAPARPRSDRGRSSRIRAQRTERRASRAHEPDSRSWSTAGARASLGPLRSHRTVRESSPWRAARLASSIAGPPSPFERADVRGAVAVVLARDDELPVRSEWTGARAIETIPTMQAAPRSVKGRRFGSAPSPEPAGGRARCRTADRRRSPERTPEPSRRRAASRRIDAVARPGGTPHPGPPPGLRGRVASAQGKTPGAPRGPRRRPGNTGSA